jgi:isoleucyl-tRNA synthetase
VNAKVMGPKLGARMKDVMTASKTGDWKVNEDGSATVGGVKLAEGEYGLRLAAKEGVASQALSTNDAVVVLDVNVTPELEAEGVARDLVRGVQQARKAEGLHVSDRISLWLVLDPEKEKAVKAHEAYVKEQTLASELTYGEPPSDVNQVEIGQGKLALRKM